MGPRAINLDDIKRVEDVPCLSMLIWAMLPIEYQPPIFSSDTLTVDQVA
jgi:hypothetical protein